jgi:hypothetical protein
MLGNLDDDAGDDTWTLMMKDVEIASGGRYDRLSFNVKKGKLSEVMAENVLDLLATHSVPYPLAEFQGLLSIDQLQSMTAEPLALESAFFQRVFAQDKKTLFANMQSDSFNETLASHPLESAGLLIGSAFFGMVAMLGLMRFLSPSTTSNKQNLDLDSFSTKFASSEIQLERSMRSSRTELVL